MTNYLNWVKVNRLTAGLMAVILLVMIGGGVLAKNYLAAKKTQLTVDLPEVDLIFEADGPYALLSPRRDGNALILNIKRVASYDAISYELAYTADGIDRGVMGNVDTSQKKGQYEQEILFGTCSKNVCKYDTGVENGTLTLHIKKDDQPYRMLIQWHMQQPDLVLGKLYSGDNHFRYAVAIAPAELSAIGFTIINELTGVPKLPDSKQIVGKVYAVNTPLAKLLPAGAVTIELADAPTADSSIFRYDDSQNKWTQLNTKVSGSILTATSDKGGIFAVLASK